MAATIKDIAKRTGLGLATISSYLNGGNVREKNRILIEAAIEELHFEVNEVARGLKTNQTKTIGVVIPELNNVFCAEIITGIEDIMRNHGYALVICDCRTDGIRECDAVEFLYRKRVDGLINMPVNQDGRHLKSFMDAGRPIVLIDRKLNGVDCDCVLVDNLEAAKQAVNIFLQNGHTRIGMIGGPADIFTGQERLMGYRLGLLEAGIIPEERLIALGDYTIRGGVRCMKELLERNPDMTAVFVANYEMTMGAVIGLNEMGIHMGPDISMIGFDNGEFARACKPKLMVVSQPTREIAQNVAHLMLERLKECGQQGKPSGGYRSRIVKLATCMTEGKSVQSLAKVERLDSFRTLETLRKKD